MKQFRYHIDEYSFKCLIFILLTLIISSCTSEQSKILKQADAVMESRPDSSMTLLESIDRSKLKRSELPYYALLYTQAQIKTNILLDSDSLISIAYAKYGDDFKGDRGLRSNFYTGEVLFYRHKNPEAMRYFLTVYEESKRLGNDYWRAKSAQRIADLYNLVYNYDEAEKYMAEAALLFKAEGKKIFHRYALIALADIYLYNGNQETAFSILDSLKNITINENPIDSVFLVNISIPLIEAMTRTNRLSGTGAEIMELRQNKALFDSDIDKSILESDVLQSMNNPEKATDDLYKALSLASSAEDKVHVLYALYKNAKAISDDKMALSLMDSLLFYQSKVAKDIIVESVTKAQRDFYADREVLQKDKSNFLRHTLIVTCLVFIILITLILIFIHYRNKAHKAEVKADMESLLSIRMLSENIMREKEILETTLEYKNSVIEDLTTRIDDSFNKMEYLYKRIADRESAVGQLRLELEDQKNEFADIRKSLIEKNQELDNLHLLLNDKSQKEIAQAEIIERLFKEKWTTLDMLCDRFFSLANSERFEKDILNDIQKELKRITSKKGIADIMDAVEKNLGGILSSLKSQCPGLKEDDICIFALSYAGFSARSICLFTGLKYKYYFVKKARLIEKIRKSNAPDREVFISKMN
ncbi:MAG: hypothetical protein K2K98_14575 [Muribaculaceae bacterium]|nr:hypothetical protein [Muribaculaceae bacterium]